jgi:Ca-activated chloride channel homolog
MILNQVVKACDPAVVDEADPITVRVTWSTPITYEAKEIQVTTTVGALLSGPTEQLTKGKAIVAYAEALKVGTSDAIKAAHDQVVAANPGQSDPELNEIAELLQKHPAF